MHNHCLLLLLLMCSVPPQRESFKQCFQSSGYIRKSGHFKIWRRSFWKVLEKSGHFCVFWALKKLSGSVRQPLKFYLRLPLGPGSANIRIVLEKDFILERFARIIVTRNITMQFFGHWPLRFRICFHQLQFSHLLDRSTYLQFVRTVHAMLAL